MTIKIEIYHLKKNIKEKKIYHHLQYFQISQFSKILWQGSNNVDTPQYSGNQSYNMQSDSNNT